ncbi:MAG: hypothetical protein V3W34_06910 [Phycisphaerae bacterium]
MSGPRRCGKSTFIEQFVTDCFQRPPHYLRLAAASGDKRQPVDARPPSHDCGVASAQWISYEPDRVFEFLPDALNKIHRQDRKGFVVIEADADPLLRHAYPYDYRVFVLPAPYRPSEVFRTKNQATEAFRSTLDDTAAFVGEIYGLVEDREKLDAIDPDASEKRSSLTAAQLRGLMDSPLGDEIATRILLQPSHHGLLESDVVLVNTAVGGTTQVVDECVRRLERVLTHVRGPEGRKSRMFACDPADPQDPLRTKCFSHLYTLLDCDSHGNGAGI